MSRPGPASLSFACYLALVLPILLLESPPAGACKFECYRSPALLPAPDATDVPLNTRLWLDDMHYQSSVTLLDASGTEIALSRDVLSTGAGDIHVLTPSTLLDAGARYELWSTYSNQPVDRLTWFTTGNEVDLEPPPRPTELDRSSRGWSRCGNICADVGAEIDLELSGEGLRVVDVDAMQDLDVQGLSGFGSPPSIKA